MRIAGALAGVVVLCVGARNGPGTGTLISSIAGNGQTQLAWQAPGSATPGIPQPVYPDGTYLLEDGADSTKFVRVQVYGSYLPTAGAAPVFVADTYNALGPDDVSAANASAGIVETVEYALANVSPVTVLNAKLWIERSGTDTRGVTVSQDGVTFVNPGSETDPNVLTWASIAPGASVNVWMQRTIPASASSNPATFNQLQFGWTGL